MEKCKERVAKCFMAREERRTCGKKGRNSDSCPKARHALGKSGSWLFLLLLVVQNWLCIDAAAEDLQRKDGNVENNAAT